MKPMPNIYDDGIFYEIARSTEDDGATHTLEAFEIVNVGCIVRTTVSSHTGVAVSTVFVPGVEVVYIEDACGYGLGKVDE